MHTIKGRHLFLGKFRSRITGKILMNEMINTERGSIWRESLINWLYFLTIPYINIYSLYRLRVENLLARSSVAPAAHIQCCSYYIKNDHDKESLPSCFLQVPTRFLPSKCLSFHHSLPLNSQWGSVSVPLLARWNKKYPWAIEIM